MFYLEKGCEEKMTLLDNTHKENCRMLDEAHAGAKAGREASERATLTASARKDEYEEAKKKVFHFKEAAHNSMDAIQFESKKIAIAKMNVHPKTEEDEPYKHWSLERILLDSKLCMQDQWDDLQRGTIYGITLKYHRLFNLGFSENEHCPQDFTVHRKEFIGREDEYKQEYIQRLKDTLGWKDVTAASRKRSFQDAILKLQCEMAENEAAVAAEQEAASGGAEEEGDGQGPAKKRAKLG